MNINTTKEIAPGLKLQACHDGVWLHFKASNGLSGSLNLPACFTDTKITHQAIKQWSKDYAQSEELRLKEEA